MAGVKKFLDFFVKIEPDGQGASLSDEDLAKILAEDEAVPGGGNSTRAPKGSPPPAGVTPGQQPAGARTLQGAGATAVPPAPRMPPSQPIPGSAPAVSQRVSAVAAPAVFQMRQPAPGGATPDELPDFETIYKAAKVPAPAHGYTVDRVEAMLGNPRLAGMSESVKANSVLMALEVAGVSINDVVSDAVARDRAIDDFEAWWAAKVGQLESDKRAENAAIEDEMNRYLEAQRERIRGNNAAVQKAVETFTTWKDRKRVEEQRLYQTVSPFVTENPITLNTGAVAPIPGPAPGGRRTP